MGGAASSSVDGSTSQMTRELRMLLGNFDRLDPMTQRLVSLGKACLTSSVLDSQSDQFRKLDRFNAESGSYVEGQGHAEESGQGHIIGASGKKPSTVVRKDEDKFHSVHLVGCEVDAMKTGCETDVTDNVSLPEGAQTSERSDESTLFYPLEQARPIYFGQTYPRWKMIYRLQNFYSMCVPTRKIIYIQPIDEFPEFLTNFRISMKSLSLDVFSLLQGFTQIFFSGLDVAVMPSLSMEKMGWQNLVKSRHHKVTGEKQYLAKDFYTLLQKVLPSDGHCILGLVWTDLYPEEDLNFILGETSFTHRSGIFCFGRFETKDFNQTTHKDITEVDSILIWKLIRVISHELCHLFGLRHCTYFHCSMNESSSLLEAMEQPLFLCPVCLRKLHQVCHFDVLDRYTQMLDFLSELQSQLPSVQCDKAISWLQNCIAYLQQPDQQN